MATRVRSFSKINLGLAVGPTRPDGYHGLTTCYQTVALHDFVTVSAKPAEATRITLEANHPGVPCTARGDCDRNTAYKMISGALERLGMAADVRVEIDKRLPVQGGLGAGSANAAAALLGLERELGKSLPAPERLDLAAAVGSDVPLFLVGGTVLGLDRGQSVFPLPDSPALPMVVAVPSVGVSTGQAFGDLDRQMANRNSHTIAPGLTGAAPEDRLEQLSRVLTSVWTLTGAERETTGIAATSFPVTDAPDSDRELDGNEVGDLAGNPLLALVRTGVENDFEDVAFQQHPSLRAIKHALTGESSGDPDVGVSGASYAALSGSGSALFGIYGSAEAALLAQHRVQSLGVRALLTETLPRSGYWRQMFA